MRFGYMSDCLYSLTSFDYSDLWLASSSCTGSACQGIPSFNPLSSSTFNNTETPFSITYGSGQAAGTLGNDVVQMAGFAVSNQVLAVCDEVSTGLLNNPVSGLMGLAFRTIASSKATPFWETLASSNAWAEPLMAFQLTRSVYPLLWGIIIRYSISTTLEQIH